MSRFMFDTNVFGKILRMQVPHSLSTDKHEYFVTRAPRWNAPADLNNDGRIDGKDIVIVAIHFGES